MVLLRCPVSHYPSKRIFCCPSFYYKRVIVARHPASAGVGSALVLVGVGFAREDLFVQDPQETVYEIIIDTNLVNFHRKFLICDRIFVYYLDNKNRVYTFRFSALIQIH